MRPGECILAFDPGAALLQVRTKRNPISEENIELMRGGYEAMARGDFEAVLALMDPAVEMHDRPEVPDAGTYHGHEGVLAALRQSFEAFDDFRMVPEQFIDADDRVVVIIRMTGRGRTSGVGVEDRIAHLWRLREGRAIHLQVYSDPDEALAAIGRRTEGSAQAG